MDESIGEMNFNYLLKYVIVGDASVGKSNLLLRFTQGSFNSAYQLTIGVEFGSGRIIVENEIFRVQIWDTAGQENFRSITRSYYKNSACALLVYDISKKESFESIQSWIDDCKSSAPETVLMVLVGNKSDLTEERKVSEEEGREFAEKNGLLFFETSAKTGKNVEEVFTQSATLIAKKIKDNYYDLENDSCGIKKGYYNLESGNCGIKKANVEDDVVLQNPSEKDKSGCC